jgi:hypothetical protein
MNYLDLSNVSATSQAPFLKVTGDHLNEGIGILTQRYFKDILPASFLSSSTKVTIVSGCDLDTIVKDGIVAYNGEVFDFENINSLADGYFAILDSYIATDPVQYSDGNNYSQHAKRRMILQASSVGSTGVLYSGNDTRFMNLYESNKDYLTNKIPVSVSGLNGNQFKLNSIPAAGSYDPPLQLKITNTGASKNNYKVFSFEVDFVLVRDFDAISNPTSNIEIRLNLSNYLGTSNANLVYDSPAFDISTFSGVCFADGKSGFIQSYVKFNNTTKIIYFTLASYTSTRTEIDLNTATALGSDIFDGKIRVNLLIS